MIELTPVSVRSPEVQALFRRFHAYGGTGSTATYALGVREGSALVAVYLWQPPAPGAARAVCPEAPHGVLALSRMVAVPRAERVLKHVSKPLRWSMKHHLDRTRWPVLITYSDAGAGHTGYVYQCSGWERTTTSRAPYYQDGLGNRVSKYSNGGGKTGPLVLAGHTDITRWEHWACPRGQAAEFMAAAGWHRVLTGKTWRSGNPAGRWVQGKESASENT